MTRKDYQLIASILKEDRVLFFDGLHTPGQAAHALHCTAFADRLQSENPRFDRARFLRACGLEV